MSEIDKILPVMLDDEFAKILTNDPVLNELEKLKFNEKDQFLELMILLNNQVKICGVEVNAITPAIWSFLYAIKSPFVIRDKKIKNLDIDVLMYILHRGINRISDNLFAVANGFCKSKNLNYFVVEKDLLDLIRLAFRAVEMFPAGQANGEQPAFNADWLTRIVSMACQVTNETATNIMLKMPLTACLYYVAQYARKNDIHNTIKRRNSAEIDAAIYERTFQLGKQYYNDNYKGK